ncbi:penicillin acylase family protein [Arsenicicoccus dermatophilus]|uniref:penicillin acylase family protein n=1 Tax=Arsenicicoccus dermatophilus TaxID=1076331 RepID=UPI001F4D22A6|nr:penicillin acylase family protein [Arsenicicoccus dermatophilus]
MSHAAQIARRTAVTVVALLVVAALIVTGVLWGAVSRTDPDLGGEQRLGGLSGRVDVRRDAQGVPNIEADTPEDLFRGQGYVDAQDRFFQMDLRRHATSGRLAELVGEAGVASDKGVRTMGWRRTAEAELPMLSADTRRYLTAYADGVNAYLERTGDPTKVAPEYLLLGVAHPGYTIERWGPVDSLVWLKAMAWDLKGNVDDELARARLMAQGRSLAEVAELYPPYAGDRRAPILSPADWKPGAVPHGGRSAGRGGIPALQAGAPAALDDTARTLAAVRSSIGSGAGLGSNSWVVGPRRSSTGKPLLANDPHLELEQPGIWHQVSLRCRTLSTTCPYAVSGFTFAGFPGVVIGHNQRIAWGFTNLDPDVTDLYLERLKGDTVLKDGRWLPVSTRTETIKVAGGPDRTVTVRSTSHGPIVSGVLDGTAEAAPPAAPGEQSAVALRWTALDRTTTADAIFRLDRATDFTSFREALKSFVAPSQNATYADVDGHIGYQAPGLVPIRRAGTAGTPPGYLPVPGWESRNDWNGYVPFDQLPWAYDPPEGLVVTANQQVTPSTTPFLTTDWSAGWRSARIRTLLDEGGPVTPQRMRDIQSDSSDAFQPILTKALLAVDLGSDSFTKEGQDTLRGWDGRFVTGENASSRGAAYFAATWSALLHLTFDDDLPTGLRPDGGARWAAVVEGLLDNPRSPWWDDQKTLKVETRDDILRRAQVDARLELTRRTGKEVVSWDYGRLHRLTLRHPLGEAAPGLIGDLLDRGPHPAPGTALSPNALGADLARSYDVSWGPSMRMVVDLGSLDSSTWVQSTGVSGHPTSGHYDDQTARWLTNDPYPWPFSPEAIARDSVDQLILRPADGD